MESKINYWFDKKEKLKTKKDLKIVKKYLDEICEGIESNIITFSNDIKFEYNDYYNEYEINNIRPESVFKIIWIDIINQFKKLFKNINYEIEFECPCYIETLIKKRNHVINMIFILKLVLILNQLYMIV